VGQAFLPAVAMTVQVGCGSEEKLYNIKDKTAYNGQPIPKDSLVI